MDTHPTTINTRIGLVAVGNIIEYRVFGGEDRRVRVTEVYPYGIKNDRPGFDGVAVATIGSRLEDGAECWGYADQITRRVTA